MPTFTISRVIAAPVAETFRLASDIEGLPGRIKGITKVEKLTPGPVGVGTRYKETRVMFKREASETFEFTAFEPDRRYEVTASSCGAEYRCEFRFTPEGAGTRVDVTFQVRAVSFVAKLFSPLAPLMMGTMRRCVEADLSDLEKALSEVKSEK
jgi:carbon monoxide dehydrogenase subunit G